VQQFEKLFQFAQRVENLLYTISPEEVPFQLGFSKMDLRKILKTSLAGVKFYFHSYCCLLETARALNCEGVSIHKKVLLHISDTNVWIGIGGESSTRIVQAYAKTPDFRGIAPFIMGEVQGGFSGQV
jgi:hypothetical protein